MENFNLITKPEQSGKTFVMIKKMNEFLAEEEDIGKDIVNFVFCDNSLLLTKQTKERMKGIDLSTLSDIEEPYIELSSRKDGSAKGSWRVARDAIEDGCRFVVCCTNTQRVKDIEEIIMRMNKHNNQNYEFKIWLDEADKYLNYIEKSFQKLSKECKNVNIYLITATPQPIFKKYKEVKTLALENTTGPYYHGWDDCIINIREDEAGSAVGFARQIADEMISKKELVPGAIGYVPANTNKKSHNAMRDMFLMKGVAVFLVNGDGIELSIPSEGKIDLTKKNDELKIHIKELYEKFNLKRWACVVTGNICVSRGISIMTGYEKNENKNFSFMFTFGILSNCSKKTEVSQHAGRLKGNIKNWVGYAPPRVYTTEKFNKIAKQFEIQSREIAKLAFAKNGNSEGTAIITESETKNLIAPDNYRAVIFDTFEEARKIGLIYFDRNFKYRTSLPKELSKLTKNGTYPTAVQIKTRNYGINKKSNKKINNSSRLYPIADGKWCMYWNKTLVKDQVEKWYNGVDEKYKV